MVLQHALLLYECRIVVVVDPVLVGQQIRGESLHCGHHPTALRRRRVLLRHRRKSITLVGKLGRADPGGGGGGGATE
jgi:hypothetical protein